MARNFVLIWTPETIPFSDIFSPRLRRTVDLINRFTLARAVHKGVH